jgi:HEAT repeat protein
VDHDGGAELLRLLAGDSEALSLYAARALEGSPVPGLLDAVRSRLGRAGDELAEALLDLLEEDVEPGRLLEETLASGSDAAQAAVVLRLGAKLGGDAEPVLLEALRREPNTGLRGVLLGSLGRSDVGPLPESAGELILGALGASDPRVRANAAEVIGARIPDEVRELLPLLEDGVPRVRAAAARGLWDVEPGAVEAVVRDDLSSGEPRRVLAALHVLGSVPGFPEAGGTLCRYLKDDSPQIRLMACRGLADRGESLPAPLLAERYLVEDSDSCRRAVAGLGRTGPREELVTLLADELAGSGDARVRARAARGLGELGGEGAERALVLHTGEADPRVRAQVVEALGLCGGDRVVPVLEAALDDLTPRVAANAALALGRRGGREALARLGGWVRGADLARARSAAFALGEIGSAEVVGPLLEAAERLRDGGADAGSERALLKQILKALTKVRSGP